MSPRPSSPAVEGLPAERREEMNTTSKALWIVAGLLAMMLATGPMLVLLTNPSTPSIPALAGLAVAGWLLIGIYALARAILGKEAPHA
jgi:hypothetical protein